MSRAEWVYVAPHRIRAGILAFPKPNNWKEIEELNMQRLARVFEFRGCVAFVGSGASRALVRDYPGWDGLVPCEKDFQKLEHDSFDETSVKELLALVAETSAKAHVSPTQAVQILQRLLGKDGKDGRKELFCKYIFKKFDSAAKAAEAQDEARGPADKSPFQALLDLPIRRFVTTNYDMEIERALEAKLGASNWNRKESSFEQDDIGKLSAFAVTLATKNRNMVFHCHGTIEKEKNRLQSASREQSRMVVTDDDYNYWYLAQNREVASFRTCLEIILQSNPVLFVGYTIGDVDLRRVLRKASLRWESGRLASNLFLLLGEGVNPAKEPGPIWCEAEQIRLGVNLLPYAYKTDPLGVELRKRQEECWQWRKKWRRQPLVRPRTGAPTGLLALPVVQDVSLLGRREATPSDDGILEILAKLFGWRKDLVAEESLPQTNTKLKTSDADTRPPENTQAIVALVAPRNSGKFVVGCQFVEQQIADHHHHGRPFRPIVLHGYHTQDFTGYVIGIGDALRAALVDVVPHKFAARSGQTDGNREQKRKENYRLLRFLATTLLGEGSQQMNGPRFLLLINDLDRVLGVRPSGPHAMRHSVAERFVRRLLYWNHILSAQGTKSLLRILITASHMPAITPGFQAEDAKAPWKTHVKWAVDNSSDVLDTGAPAGVLSFHTSAKRDCYKKPYQPILEVRLDERNLTRPFAPEVLGLVSQLSWELGREYSALVLAATHLTASYAMPPAALSKEESERRLKAMLEALQSNSSESGTRVVRHVIRALDADVKRQWPKARNKEDEKINKEARVCERLLGYLSCLTGPIDSEVFADLVACSTDATQPVSRDVVEFLIDLLTAAGLILVIRPVSNKDPGEVTYVAHSLVKRFFRLGPDYVPATWEMSQFPLHGLLSRGPFPSPLGSDSPKCLFEFLAREIWKHLDEVLSQGEKLTQDSKRMRSRMLALLDALRSNFAANSVPNWGQYRDYIDMLSVTIDLLRNVARCTGCDWQPGEEDISPSYPERWSSPRGIASAEEMIHLYNELGLSYYATGSAQDALNVWSLAFDWQKVVERLNPLQGLIYSQTLYSHIGMAYMQLGRMRTAAESFERAKRSACRIRNEDLQLRMDGMMARLEHFKGSIEKALQTYTRVIDRLEKLGNLRAQSYFMRHLAAVYVRLGNLEKAGELARKSMAIATSQKSRDLVAFSSEIEARILAAKGDPRAALRAYRMVLKESREMDTARLQADVELGMANIQLQLGDATAAQRRGVEGLKIANENLLVQRQVKALLVLGKAAAEAGEVDLARHTLQHASSLAAESQFLLSKRDAQEALAELGTGGLQPRTA
jgi:tetratricopeptide (TPR) repeat protein